MLLALHNQLQPKSKCCLINGSFQRTRPVKHCRRGALLPCIRAQGSSDVGDAEEGGISVPRRQRADWDIGPGFHLTREDAIHVQLQALKENNVPYPDHGVEVLYRFANLDPFARSNYFGRPIDLGQFERFRRIFHSAQFRNLLCHSHAEVLSSLEVSETVWCARMAVQDVSGTLEATYRWTLARHVGGRYDGYWFTQSLLYDGDHPNPMKL